MSPTPSRPLTFLLVALLGLPVVGLVLATDPRGVIEALRHADAQSALGLTLLTSGLAMVWVLALGTPAAWALSRTDGRLARLTTLAITVPVVLPPAVLGVALLETFGRTGLLGPGLGWLGVQLPFTAAAVVLTQVLVGMPLYVLASSVGFRAVPDDTLLVARTLGASPARAWWTIALPAALPGVLAGLALAWLRALGEFGATLLFAGNLPGRTQTLTLAIFQALERDLVEAHALALVLMVVGLAPLLLVWLVRGRRT